MKNKVLLGIIALLAVILGVEGFILLTKDNSSDKEKSHINEDNFENNSSDTLDNSKLLVSKEGILALAEQQDLYIYNDFTNQEYVDDYDVILEVLNNKLYLSQNDKKSLIINDIGNVVQIKNAMNSCTAATNDILILTDTGDLYQLNGVTLDKSRFSSNIFDKLSKNENILLELERINPFDVKVLGFIDSNGDGRGWTCGFPTQYIYTDDKKVRDYQHFLELEHFVIDYVDGGYCADGNFSSTLGFVIYNNHTVSINNKDLLYNKDQEVLVLKDYYFSKEGNYIIDVNDYLYIENGNISCSGDDVTESKFELFKDSKVKNVDIQGNRVLITFWDSSEELELRKI